MQTFLILWLGQLISTIGSFMTVFGLTLWVWDQTQSTTALVLVGFFSQVPRICVTTIAGIWVDRVSRKRLMLIGEVAALCCTAGVAFLYFTSQLQVWHLYVAVFIYGGFGQLQILAYSASIALLVPPSQFTRAESMGAAVSYGAAIVAPALAGNLYPTIGLRGIFLVDLATFFASLLALIIVKIPRPTAIVETSDNAWSWDNLTFGFRYIFRSPELLAMMAAFTLFALPSDINKALYSPMILARTGGDAQILGNVTAAAGIGGVLGAVLLSVWGGFRHRVNGMLVGFIGYGFFKVVMATTIVPPIWMATHFLASLHIPMFYSSSNAIWYAKVPTALQGRVLAADQLVGVVISTIAPLMAGLLADRWVEPLARSGQIPGITTSAGSGIALLYGFTAVCTVVVGIGGYLSPQLRDLDRRLPDQIEPIAVKAPID